MRYTKARTYPITKIKSLDKAVRTESLIDISLGTAAGILCLAFLKGVLFGYLLRKNREGS